MFDPNVVCQYHKILQYPRTSFAVAMTRMSAIDVKSVKLILNIIANRNNTFDVHSLVPKTFYLYSCSLSGVLMIQGKEKS